MATNRQLGAAGEAAVASAFLQAGADIYTPAVDTGADLVVDVRGRLYRVQVKTSSSSANSIQYRLSHRCSPSDRYSQNWAAYEPGQVDWFALYSTYHSRVVLIPGDTVSKVATVVYPPGKVRQGNNTYDAALYDLEAVTARV